VTKGNGHKLKYRKFSLNIRKYYFTVRVAGHGKKLLREAVKCPSSEIFKAQPDTVRSSLLPLALLEQGLGGDDLKSASSLGVSAAASPSQTLFPAVPWLCSSSSSSWCGTCPTPSHGVLIPTAEKCWLRDRNSHYDCLQQIFLDLITQTVY